MRRRAVAGSRSVITLDGTVHVDVLVRTNRRLREGGSPHHETFGDPLEPCDHLETPPDGVTSGRSRRLSRALGTSARLRLSGSSEGRKYYRPTSIRNRPVGGEINDPNQTSFELQLKAKAESWLVGAGLTNADGRAVQLTDLSISTTHAQLPVRWIRLPSELASMASTVTEAIP